MELEELRQRMTVFEGLLAANTTTTKQTRDLLKEHAEANEKSQELIREIGGWGSELREWMIASRKGLQVLGWLGGAAKWLGGAAGGAWAIYEAYKRLRG